MKLLAIAALTLLTASAPAPDFVMVSESPGGLVDEFVDQRHEWERKGLTIKIKGDCYSACAIYTGAKNVCLEPDAMLWFHHGSDYNGTMTTMIFMDPEVREWLGKRMMYLPTNASGEFIGLDAEDAIGMGMMDKCQ